ncbi:MAG: co-chaperone GroES [Nitrosarchaeum sp.]|nr:co-chaperone GroES [Nitrosarchaeum sp.]
MNITPMGERVLLRPAKEEEKTKGGIYIPDTAKEKKKRGEVIAVGTFLKGTEAGKPLPLKKGDKVLYGGYSSDEVEIDGEDLVFVEFKDILAKVQ